jgi:hypothetical protein
MPGESGEQATKRAIELLRAGEKDGAREILKGVLRRDRDNPLAWAAMVQAAASDQEAILCLKQVLRLKPGDPWATKQLQRLDAAASQPAPVEHRASAGDSARIQALRLTPVQDPIARARSQEQALQTRPGPTLEESVSDQTETGASRLASRLMLLPWVLVGVIVIAVGFTVWKEFFVTYPEDEQKVVQSASDWTVSTYRMDYKRLSELACGKYASDVNEIREASMFFDALMNPLGIDLGSEPPRTVRYEIDSMKGSTARVHVYGLAGDLDLDVLEDFGFPLARIDERIYVMKREGREWKWCGEESVIVD